MPKPCKMIWRQNGKMGRGLLRAIVGEDKPLQGIINLLNDDEVKRFVDRCVQAGAARAEVRRYVDRLIERIGQPDPTAAEELVNIATDEGVDFFHSRDGQTFGAIADGAKIETYVLAGSDFRSWLIDRYFEKRQKPPPAQAVTDAVRTLEALATRRGDERPVHVRCARHYDDIYFDLADSARRVIRVTPDGWTVMAHHPPPVHFLRPRGMHALPVPQRRREGRPSALFRLREVANLASDDDFALVAGWLVGALMGRGPYPILIVGGEQSSGKTTLCRFLKLLLDPGAAALRAMPHEERDLMIAANNSLVPAFDNLSFVEQWLSDALCRLATGCGFQTRKLYTDSEESLFEASRPLILNGIEDLAHRSDLLDRSIRLHLEPLEEGQRRADADVWQTFEAVRPAMLGALLDCVVEALRKEGQNSTLSLTRMADFHLFAARGLSAVDADLPAQFDAAYRANRAAADELAIETSAIGEPLREWIVDEPGAVWRGTMSELLNRLESEPKNSAAKMRKNWPGTPRKLAADLKRLAPNLRKIGLFVNFPENSRGTVGRVYELNWRPATGG